ncbi:Apolipoprotein N-acyltransferase [Roseivivax sp. THAF40]|uniref:apolipoprotein N-acyltransferase n=1 Tax=unclassified Roseivivax TaxID=2639302 RepID=UPI00126917B1|nr:MULTISPECIES: apolipoprotein N-acyltransferase [unclassified Roseivivax]QFS81683.1 Apolipoprotein N-acyltransferase [Roseivivax sp. THAF197b]QFT45475.1 Apolipoprotein N-acyltransferase [Roseivivax sp. THAF40]
MADTGRAAEAPSRAKLVGGALFLGLVFATGQAPFDLWYLALAALAAAIWLIGAAGTPRQAGWTGWAFGAGYFGFSMSWLVEPFLVDAAVTGWMAPFALILAAGGFALFWAWPAWAAIRAGQPWLLVPLWALSELLRAYLLTGFPWGMVGYVLAPTTAVQWVALIGPHGLNLVVLALAAMAVAGLERRDLRLGLATCLGAALLFGGGWARLAPPAPETGRPVIRLVQPNAPQDEKWQPGRAQMFFERQVSASAAAPRPDFILWPETAVPVLLNHAEEALRIISEAAGPVPVLLGIQREEAGRYYNSSVLIGPNGQVRDTYDKHHLVPFGEYMPAAWFFRHINVSGLAQRAEYGYSSGPGPRLLDLGALGQALPLICYEAVFPQDVGGAPERADMILQMTNDAWFGKWSGPYQHLMQARLRAIEQGLPVMRSANTGVSAVIDGYGRIRASLPLGQSGYVDAAVPPPLAPTLYARSGDLPILLWLLGCVGLGLWRWRGNRIDAAQGHR